MCHVATHHHAVAGLPEVHQGRPLQRITIHLVLDDKFVVLQHLIWRLLNEGGLGELEGRVGVVGSGAAILVTTHQRPLELLEYFGLLRLFLIDADDSGLDGDYHILKIHRHLTNITRRVLPLRIQLHIGHALASPIVAALLTQLGRAQSEVYVRGRQIPPKQLIF